MRDIGTIATRLTMFTDPINVAPMPRRFRFRLITMFSAITLIACVLAGFQWWARVPIRTGTMSGAICYAKDFEKLISSRQGQKAGDFTLYTFDATAPAGLFTGFSPSPEIWPDGAQISEINYYNYPMTGAGYLLHRNRPANRPIGGWQERWDSKDKSAQPIDVDEFWAGGTIKESAIPPTRYFIDCVVRLTLEIPKTRPAITTIADIAKKVRSKQPSPIRRPIFQSNLLYVGPQPQGLLVFSRPIDDELVQLVILDLRK